MNKLFAFLLLFSPCLLIAQNIDENIAARLNVMTAPVIPPLVIDFLDFPLVIFQTRDETNHSNWLNTDRTESIIDENDNNTRIAIAGWDGGQWVYEVEADITYGYASPTQINNSTIEINGLEVAEFAPVVSEFDYSHDSNGNIIEAESEISINQAGLPVQLASLTEQVYSNNQLQVRLNYAPGLPFFPLEFSDRITYSWDGDEVEESETETFDAELDDFVQSEKREFTYSAGIMESYVLSEYDAEDGFYKAVFSRAYQYIEGGKISVIQEFELNDTSLFGDRYSYDYNEDLELQEVTVENTEDGATWINDSRQVFIYENDELTEIQIFAWDGSSWTTSHVARVLFSEEEPMVTPPAAPANLAASINAADPLVVDLTWSENATDESGYSLERSDNGVDFAEVSALSANTSDASDSGLSSQTTYFYRVRAFNEGGNSAWSNTAEITTSAVPPATPINLTAFQLSDEIDDLQVQLNWIDASDNEDGFVVERKLDGEWEELATLSENTVEYVDVNVEWIGQANYRVYASNSNDGNSDFSNEAIVDLVAIGLAENTDHLNTWKSYPNPTSDLIQLSFSNLEEKRIDIVDLTGKVIQTSIIATGKNASVISVKELPRGLYVLILTTGQSQSSRSIFIN